MANNVNKLDIKNKHYKHIYNLTKASLYENVYQQFFGHLKFTRHQLRPNI